MRLVVQRVSQAQLSIEENLHASIGLGLLVLIGIEDADNEEDIFYLCSKLVQLRIFSDADNKMNLDLKQIQGEILLVSQFTLHASTRKGNRPSFIKAASPAKAIPLYEKFITLCSDLLGKPIQTGVFGAEMNISMVNSGPVTILLDSKNKE